MEFVGKSAWRVLSVVGALLIACATARGVQPRPPLQILLTADTEGHVGPCSDCPLHAGNGGLDRRATVVAKLRADGGGALFVADAGNFLFGPESVASDGRVIIDAYDLLKYDAVNLCWRDFRQGKQHTLDLLSSSKFAAVSANLLDAGTSQPLFKPYVLLKSASGSSVAVLGLTEVPASLQVLPYLKQQLAGIRIDPPLEALAKWLPKAKSESDQVVLLYYGSARSLEPIREKFGGDLAAILVGGARPDELPADAKPPVVGVEEHGKFIAKIELTAGQAAQTAQLPVEPSLAPDPAMVALLAKFQPPTEGSTPAPASPPAASPAPAVAAAPQPAPIAAPKPPEPPPAPVPAPPVHLQPKGLPGVGLTAGQVNQAIDRGSEFLWNYIKTKDLKRNEKLGDEEEHLLCCLALVHANANKRFPDFDSALRQYLASFEPEKLGSHRTYQAGLLCMLIESYGDATYIPKLRIAARYLLESQGQQGTWNYEVPVDPKLFQNPQDERALQVAGGTPLEGPGSAGEPWQRITPWDKGADGDNSNTQYAILGLNSASRTGIVIPPETWKRNLTTTLGGEFKGGGFGYTAGASPYGSMTCAGICMLAVDRHWLGDKNVPDDPAIARGVKWLDANFSVTTHPKHSEWLYYYLYSLERVGRLLDTEFIGTHEWYPLGARYLVDSQKPDGSWIGSNREEDPRLATSFALLFLTRATPTLNVTLKRGGSGTLKTAFIPRSTRLYIILDASGSMLDEMDGRMKFDIARDAVRSLVKSLPDSTQVALRVYGSRKRAIEPGADADTLLEIPLGPLDRSVFNAKLDALRARGKTPLARSLNEAASDLRNATQDGDHVTVLLLTDGGEDTRQREDPLKAAEEFGKLKNISLQIVGFDINREDWSQQLAQMARLAHAQYWPAAKAGMLQTGLRAAVLGDPEDFQVFDKSGAAVARGKFGQSLTLPEGKYTLRSALAGQALSADFWINTDAATAVTFDARKLAIPAGASLATTLPSSPSPAQPAPAQTSPPQTPPAQAAKFCTHCGKPLPPGAKFCPSCGAKVE